MLVAAMKTPQSAKLTKQNAYIWRIIHIENMPAVWVNGCQCRTDTAANSFTDIGNVDLIGRRATINVPIAPGGTLSDYVPFYFTPFSPMLLNIKTGRGVPQRDMADIVILASSVHTLVEQRVPFIFTDRHAALRTAQFSDNVKDLDWIIWPVLQERDFRRDDSEKFEKYEAEVLVHKVVPMSAVRAILCYNESVAGSLRIAANQTGCTTPILAKPNWFL